MNSRLELVLTPEWAAGQSRKGTKKVAFEAPVFDEQMQAWKCVFHVDGEPTRHAYGVTAMQSLTLATRLVSHAEENME
ncbi:MAG: hypothetical protein CVT79_07030 [Alphaproteobacteria bacterium HGW-Alphaproteobacteria-18]|nr:MAG: hypothetical protein CVT79_07030 [Alphaproteobacteria bacterium HGW-Alphaproteobacteria-18]